MRRIACLFLALLLALSVPAYAAGEDTAAQRQVWRTVGNPGVILKGGKIIGIWKTRTQRENLSVSTTLWEPLSAPEQRELERQMEGYASFRGLALQGIARL